MATTAQRFFHSTTDQDFAATGEVDIRKLLESAPGTDSTTICTHANAAGTTQITLDPYTNSSTASDIRANCGWAINRLGTDGMVAIAVDQRFIPAGVWTFVMFVSIPAAGSLTGTLTVSNIYNVYRVSSAGTRTLLFSATSDTVASALAAGANSGILTATSAAQPKYILAPNETIHIGALSNMVQVAGALGATVSGVATYRVGTSAEYYEVSSPGVRTEYTRNTSILGVGTSARIVNPNLARVTTGIGTESYTRHLVAAKSFTTTGIGTSSNIKAMAKSVSTSGIGTLSSTATLPTQKIPTGSGATITNIFAVLD